MSSSTSRKRSRTETTRDDAELSNSEIWTIVCDIVGAGGSLKDKQDTYGKKYPVFAESMPFLFDMACSPHCDLDRLRYMLTMRNNVKNDRMSLNDASKHIGQTLYDEFVAPLMDAKDTLKKD